ncbi:hypothetical protein E1J38_011245 [Seonamhaeicola sediminis]|uniref:Lipocalin-like domain-containing protein n=1 Tax=Seonamhaeicola sediminis TaxID=2528206 RepID=A0A562YD15_9FLAO|nr:hypothetical protein [Seonamhaeicola sediminis]TWO31949.1 hypothetical protein E1J38_011245 [Seonamhaeicola sediminis]
MKNLSLVLPFLFIMLVISSCSKDEINRFDNIVGVWERTDFNKDYNSTYKLIFASNNTGLSINTNTFSSTETTSSISEFKWNAIDDNTISLTQNDLDEVYLLSSNGYLVLSTQQNSLFLKVSDNIQNY